MSSANESATTATDFAQKSLADASGDQSMSPELECGDPVELSFSDFMYNDFNEQEKRMIRDMVNVFHGMKHQMERSLAQELAEFLPKAWNKSRSIPSPQQHPFFKTLRGAGGSQKRLYYPHWFLLAIRWGPDHPSFIPIRKDMAVLWGVEFPPTRVFYPEDLPLTCQKTLFSGEPSDSPSIREIKARAHGFKAAIVHSNATSLIQAVTDHAPALLHRAAANPTNKEVELLKLELKSMREQLHQTREELRGVRAEFSRLEDMVKAVCDSYSNKIAVVEMEATRVEERVLQLDSDVFHTEERVDTIGRRVDKVTDTSALLLSILTAPGGEKREREEEQAEN